MLCVQEAVHAAVKRCTVKREPAERWDIYSITLVLPAAFAVSSLDVRVNVYVLDPKYLKDPHNLT